MFNYENCNLITHTAKNIKFNFVLFHKIEVFVFSFRKKCNTCYVNKKQKTTKTNAWLAEWSKALDSSSSIFGCVGSNPTPSNLLILSSRG